LTFYCFPAFFFSDLPGLVVFLFRFINLGYPKLNMLLTVLPSIK